jgi:uncharacterized protein (TIGR00661 family)
MKVKIKASFQKTRCKRVLVAPLDWGLGHAARCVPIIDSLLEQGFEVWLAGDGAVRTLLQGQFPYLPFLALPGYRIRYGSSAAGSFVALLFQVPRFLRSIRREHLWLDQAIKKHRFDVVVSDNRYGLHHGVAHCILITHQLQIKAPLPWLETLLRKLHFYFIEKFHHCWVPDEQANNTLAGALSHPVAMPKIPSSYIGLLSRLKKQSEVKEENLLLLLSGPEPQRTILERKLLQQALILKNPIVLVRGLPGATEALAVPDHITAHNYLDATGLQAAMAKATLVICRSGYSTIMDLARMNKKSVLVPTPAQPEQQYLARHLARQGYALWQSQNQLNLRTAIKDASLFPFRPFAPPADLLTDTVIDLSNKLGNSKHETVNGPRVDG